MRVWGFSTSQCCVRTKFSKTSFTMNHDNAGYFGVMLIQFVIWQQEWGHKLWFLTEVWMKSGDISSLWETLDRLFHFNFGSSWNYCKNLILYLIDDFHAQFLYSSAAACSTLVSTFLNQWYMWRWLWHSHGRTLVCGASVEPSSDSAC